MKILELLTPKRVLGNFGEDAAAKHLKKQKYSIIERNYVADDGEVDIIAEKDGVTVFVEVKTRSYKEPSPLTYRAAAAVNRKKQIRIIKCAQQYNYEHYKSRRTRFDVIEVYTEQTDAGVRVKELKHIVSAFDKSSAYSKGK